MNCMPNNFTHWPNKWPAQLRLIRCYSEYIRLDQLPAPLLHTLTEFDTGGIYPTRALNGHLPESIASIKWNKIPHPFGLHWQFPSSLTSLTLSDLEWRTPEGNSKSMQLPSTLRELILPQHEYVDEMILRLRMNRFDHFADYPRGQY